MTTRAVSAIEDWDSEPFSGGYAGLHELVDAEFSGVVQSGTAKLCLTHGTAVGILDGDIEDFEDGSGTIYEAPSPALPLLCLMQERSDEVRAKYYTEDTPISEVDRTLSDGNFSGYIELSENVLSGDYYVVYHAGRSMSVAWVGNSNQLLTDDEAFERADDEVGIYEVRPVDIEPIEIPEPDSSGASGAAASDSGTAETADDGVADDDAEDVDPDPAASGTGDDAGTATTEADSGGADAGASAAAAEAGTETAGTDGPTSAGRDGGSAEAGAETASAGTATADEGAETAEAGTETADADEHGTDAGERGAEPGDTAAGETADATGGRDNAAGARSGATESTDSTASTGSTGSSGRTERDSSASRETASERDSAAGATSGSDAAEARSETARSPDASAEESASASTGERDAGGRSRTGSESSPSSGRDRSADATTEAESTRRSETRARNGGTASDRSSADTSGNPGAGTGGARTDTDASRSEDVSPPGSLETRTIPSLDPSRSTSETPSNGGVGGAGQGAGSAGAQTSTESNRDPAPETQSDAARTRDTASQSTPDRAGSHAESPAGTDRATDDSGAAPSRSDERAAAGESQPSSGPASGNGGTTRSAGTDEPAPRVADLEAELEETEAELERVRSELADVESQQDELRRERDDLRAERDALETEVDQLTAERDELRADLEEAESDVDRLKSEIRQLEDEFGAATDAERRMSPAEALDQTNLFVRYESKGQATLESAHDGNASRQEVNENLGLEYHTQFEAANVSVAGQSFDEFLEGTSQFRFVTWVIDSLLYEIRDTGKVAALQELYDAIPQIDRAELNGTVSVEFEEDGQQRRTQESFDVVLRDRMGNSLIVANLNDSRQAATESMMNTLVTAASHVGESEDSLSGAFLVTSSFFEPEALETAAEATSGGLLSRDKRESFVKLSRKRGYHLCLAEAREDQFHLAVPEL